MVRILDSGSSILDPVADAFWIAVRFSERIINGPKRVRALANYDPTEKELRSLNVPEDSFGRRLSEAKSRKAGL